MLSYQTFATFPVYLIYSSFVVLSTFVVSSNLYHLIKLLSFSLTLSYLLTFCVIYASYKCTCCTHHKHNSISCLIVRTLSAPIYLSYSQGVFGHRAIRTVAGGFLIEQTDMFQTDITFGIRISLHQGRLA